MDEDVIELSTDSGRCAFCASSLPLDGTGIHRCSRCKTPHHIECWKENGGCGVFGCSPAPRNSGGSNLPAARSKGPDEKFCSECAAVIRAKAVICPSCGCAQPGFYPALHEGAAVSSYGRGTGVSRGVAAVLAIFFGGFGAHKFYMGRPGLGLIYVLMCFTGLPFLAGFMEGLIYLVQSDEEFRRQNF